MKPKPDIFSQLHSIIISFWVAYQKRLGMADINHPDLLSFRLASGIIWSVTGSLISRALLMVSAVVLGRILGSSGFGEFGIVQSTMALFGMSLGAVLALTITKHTAEFRTINPGHLGDTLSLFLRIGFIAGLICTFAAIVLSPWLATNMLKQASLTGELKIASILILSGILYSLQNGVIAGLEDFRLLSNTLFLRAVLALLFQIIGALKFGLFGALVGLVLSEGVTTILVHFILVRLLDSKHISLSLSRVNLNDLKLLTTFTFPILISSIVLQFASWSNNVLLVNQPEGFHSLGVFVAADKWRQILLFLPSSMSVAILPILSNLWGTKNSNDYKRVFTTNLITNLIFVLIPTIFLVILSSQAMAIYGPDYQAGWITLVILSLSAVVTMLNTILGQVLISANRIWMRSGLDIFLAVVFIILGRFLIPSYKENGLAFANLISYGLISILLFFISYEYINKGKEIVG